MNLKALVIVMVIFPLSGCLDTMESSDGSLRLATTTSMRDSGLLDALILEFENLHDVDVEYVAVGTGAALQLGMSGDVDALIVHAPEREAEFIEAGYAKGRTLIARNSFVLVGPDQYSTTIDDAFSLIYEEERCFISRGDDSGTHSKEQDLWLLLNETRGLPMVEDANGYHPSGSWYYSIGQGMGAAINMADEKSCVTLSDRATALQFQPDINLQRSEFNDSIMENQYAYLIVDSTNRSSSILFQEFLVNEGRTLIAQFTINGNYAFFVD